LDNADWHLRPWLSIGNLKSSSGRTFSFSARLPELARNHGKADPEVSSPPGIIFHEFSCHAPAAGQQSLQQLNSGEVAMRDRPKLEDFREEFVSGFEAKRFCADKLGSGGTHSPPQRVDSV
jgi:hypothetical protein